MMSEGVRSKGDRKQMMGEGQLRRDGGTYSGAGRQDSNGG
jgi:hypothetical protein